MAAMLTYQFDVHPHQRRALAYRFLRKHREEELQKQQRPRWTETPLIFEIDVAPHLRRAMGYRVLRRLRETELPRHNSRGRAWWIIQGLLLLFWGALLYGLRAAFASLG